MLVIFYFYSVNFVVSGNAVEWYFKSVTQSRHCTKPLNRLVMKHWGSVVGGSFLHAFFKVFDLFSDFFNVTFYFIISVILKDNMEDVKLYMRNSAAAIICLI